MTLMLMSQAAVRHSRVTFRCDVTQVGGYEIPLGVISDLRVGGVYGVALRVRKEISTDEAVRVGGLMREAVRTPFALLRRDFERVLNAPSPAGEFLQLPAHNSGAIHFDNIEEQLVDIPPSLRRDPDYETLRDWAADTLKASLSSVYWAMLGTEGGTFTVVEEVKTQIAEAA